MTRKRLLPILGWELFETKEGICIRLPDGRVSWPEPRERQIILAFEQVSNASEIEIQALEGVAQVLKTKLTQYSGDLWAKRVHEVLSGVRN